MKRFILNILFLTLAVSAFCEENTWIQVTMRNGSTTSYLIPERMNISFSNNTMVLSSPRMSAKLNASLVDSYRFIGKEDIDLAVNEAKANDIRIEYVNHEEVVVRGIVPSQVLKVYASNGVELSPSIKRDADSATISLSSLPFGVLIISLPNTDVPAMKIVH